jgi:hypothetical protein
VARPAPGVCWIRQIGGGSAGRALAWFNGGGNGEDAALQAGEEKLEREGWRGWEWSRGPALDEGDTMYRLRHVIQQRIGTIGLPTLHKETHSCQRLQMLLDRVPGRGIGA